jgi:hypothetical protein
MNVFERWGRVVRAEWDAVSRRAAPTPASSSSTPPRARARVPAASDVQGALRVLELSGAPSLREVREQYMRLARRYHPRTLDGDAHDPHDAHTARVVVDALTEALELLEEHLLPLPAEGTRDDGIDDGTSGADRGRHPGALR